MAVLDVVADPEAEGKPLMTSSCAICKARGWKGKEEGEVASGELFARDDFEGAMIGRGGVHVRGGQSPQCRRIFVRERERERSEEEEEKEVEGEGERERERAVTYFPTSMMYLVHWSNEAETPDTHEHGLLLTRLGHDELSSFKSRKDHAVVLDVIANLKEEEEKPLMNPRAPHAK